MTAPDDIRYSRQRIVEGIGIKGQQNISKSSVFIIGAGALGSMVAMELAAAGIGKLGLTDFDTIDISNLQRQFFYTTADTGKKKIEILTRRIESLNPDVEVVRYDTLLSAKNGKDIIGEYDIIVEASDNPATKFIVDLLCEEAEKDLIVGGVSGFRGQVSVFCNGECRFKDIFNEVKEGGFMPCDIAGVMGPAVGVCASIQASEVLKIITGINDGKQNYLVDFDLKMNRFSTICLG